MTQSISYQDWSDFLLRIGAICEPSELHGMAIGYICGQQALLASAWAAQASAFMDLIEDQGGVEISGALQGFYDINSSILASGDYQLQLLLPDDALPLATRIDSLAKWSQGFLHGLAIAEVGIAQRLDETAQESLRDIAEIAQASNDLSGDESGEGGEGEAMYSELVEFVRLAVFNIYAQLHLEEGVQPKPTCH